MNSSFPLLKRFLLAIGIPVTLALVGIYFYFAGGLPDKDVTLSLPGLTTPVRIHRNDVGVPTIEAKTDRDVFFSMG